MKFIVLAGGSGTRLWPLSRKNFPKQFLKIPSKDNNEPESFFQKTLRRLSLFPDVEIFIITNEKYKFYVYGQIEEIKKKLRESIKTEVILEPAQRNTASAIALAVKYALQKGVSSDEVFFVSPSDHLIDSAEKFINYVNESEKIAKEGFIVTFGIKPTRPETGFGYIKVKNPNGENKNFYEIEQFVEKPDIETAKRYIEDGRYYWNSGMFAFTAQQLIAEFKEYISTLSEIFEKPYEQVLRNFKDLPDISLDYAVMEKTKRGVLLPLEIFWSDIGSWESLYEVLPKDKDKNAKIAETINISTKSTLILGNKRLIATLGVEDLIIVETDDALLIAKKGECQKVKDIVNILSEKSYTEVEEHTTVYRPWGSFTLLERGLRYKIKRITVNPGASLSLQMHHHRSEHWVVVKGTAKVLIGQNERFVHENESVYVPKSTLHRLENPGKIPLEIIEVQVGEYVEEDDIKRLEDVYERTDI
jgi:mannose-1-phosphate guanylyltransferase/mannose-6-phosphate isomerase